jgi:hypothetical protein
MRIITNTLEKSKFKVRTDLGDSDSSYQHSQHTPIHGTGQGSTASPSIWLMTSSFIMDIYEELAHGMTLTIQVQNNKTMKQFMLAFVDDASKFANTEHNQQSVISLKHQLGQDALTMSGRLEL